MKLYQKPFYYCAPGDKIPEKILEKLKEINNAYSTSKDFSKYIRDIAKFFKLDSARFHSTTELKLFFGGFVEGEGSLNISAKKLKNAKFGLTLDAEFSVTQHINGVNHLFAALSIFQTGRIRYKDGSNATLVFTIDNRTALEEKVIPFYENYVAPYASLVKMERLEIFKEFIRIFKEKGHLDLDIFLNQALPLWDSLRMQKDQKNQTFASLEESQDFVRNHVQSQPKIQNKT